MKIYGIFDKVAGKYNLFLSSYNDGGMCRELSERLAGSIYDSHNSDFDLYVLASINEDTGTVVPINPTIVARFIDIFGDVDNG